MPTNYVQQRHKQKQFFLVFVFVLTFVWMDVCRRIEQIYLSVESILPSIFLSHVFDLFSPTGQNFETGSNKNLTFRPNVVSCHFHFFTLSARFANYLVWHYSRLIYPQHNFQMWRQKSFIWRKALVCL